MASTGFHFTDVGWNIYVQLRWLLPQWRSRTVPRIRNFHQIFKQTQREEYGTREHSLWMQRERTSGGPYSVLLSLWLQPTPTLPDWVFFLLRVNTCLRCVFVGFSMKIWHTLQWSSTVRERCSPTPDWTQSQHLSLSRNALRSVHIRPKYEQVQWINQTYMERIHAQDCPLTSGCSTFSVGAWASKQLWDLRLCSHWPEFHISVKFKNDYMD